MSMAGPRWRGFYFITDSGLSPHGVVKDVRLALAAGVALVQYREKTRGRAERLAEARDLVTLCKAAGVPLIVNDDLELAVEVGADGAHVGQEDAPLYEARRVLGEKAIIGVSVRDVEQTREAQAGGADYVAASPVFATATKLDAGPGVGIEGLKAIRAATSLTLAAIGGISRANVAQVHAAGADLICAISESLAGSRIIDNVRALAPPER